MALTVRMLSLVSRLGAPSALNAWSCRFKSRDAGATVRADHQSGRFKSRDAGATVWADHQSGRSKSRDAGATVRADHQSGRSKSRDAGATVWADHQSGRSKSRDAGATVWADHQSGRSKSRDAGATVRADHQSGRSKIRDAGATVWADRQSHTQYSRASDRRPRRSQEMFEEDSDLEDVEDKLQKIMDEERKQQRTVKYHIIKRQMTPSGPPERKLSWASMEQIRYLKQEQPEEWTVVRLAEGFSVTPDVILRVLRSKFNPIPERQAKQDAKVMAKLSQQQALPPGRGQEQDRPRLPSHSTAALLPAESSASALVTLSSRQEGLVTQISRQEGLVTQISRQEGLVTQTSRQGSRALAANPGGPPDSLATLPTHLSESLTVPSQPAPVTASSSFTLELDIDDEEEGWDGEVFLEEEIEELMLTAKRSPVAQVGNEFFDNNGNFLYRI